MSKIRISIADMTTLGIRTSRSRGSALPELLYQTLPISALSLMATLPPGSFPISIPHESQPNRGFPIRENPPESKKDWILVYALQADRRYQAIEILYQGKRWTIEDFRHFARRWVENHAGSLRLIEGRYAYEAPSRELWNVIQRDSGYVAFLPSQYPHEITPQLIEKQQDSRSSGVIIRVPLYTGEKLPLGEALPAFAPVELTSDPHPGPSTVWMGFDAFRKEREVQSQPPAPLIPDFLAWLKGLEKESGFESFVFRPGMCFGDCIEWWGDRNRRRTSHEGLDFAEGRTADGSVRSIPEGTPVRAVSGGEIVAVLDDFLAKTVVLRHPSVKREDGSVLHSLYSHIHPESDLSGTAVAGRLLGRVLKSKGGGAPAHLHLTAAWIPESVAGEGISLEYVSASFAPVILINFNGLLGKRLVQ